MTRTRMILLVSLLLFAVGLGVLFITRKDNTQQAAVIASFYPLFDFSQQVAGDRMQVVNLTPAGAEPHDFEPTPRQITDLQRSPALIYSGVGLEPWVDALLGDYKGVGINAGAGIELEGNDPHIWLDPVLAQRMVMTIREGLTRASPGDAAYFDERADAYIAKLTKLDYDIAQALATCQRRTIITSHDAFGYFAKRYNLHVMPIAGLSPDEEPSPAKLAELSTLAKSQGMTHIFFESLVSPRLAETIAHEVGAQTAVFDTIEGLTDEEQRQGKDYIAIQYQNLGQLRTALACQ